MQVLIMRHGEAVPDAASDAVRPLTLNGSNESRQMANWLCTRSLKIERVCVSPYLRAQQTLAALREVLPLPVEEETLPELTPGGEAERVASYIRVLAAMGVNSVLLVSHLPLVGYLIAELCPGESPPMFATSSVACVELDAESGCGQFEWQFSPSQLSNHIR